MQFRVYLCIQYIIFNILHNSVDAKPLSGLNVRYARRNEFGFLVSIKQIGTSESRGESRHICTGTLVSRRDVLTAAHCFNPFQTNEIVLVLGSVNFEYGRSLYPSFWITYDRWLALKNMQPRFPVNDICVLRLSTDVPGNIVPASLSPRSYMEIYGSTAITAGWSADVNGIINKFLMTAGLSILSNTDCQNKLGNHIQAEFRISENFFCTTADPYVYLCPGDSGGPLLYNNKVVGVNKGTCLYSELEFHPDKVNVHMSVAYYERFIQDIIRNF